MDKMPSPAATLENSSKAAKRKSSSKLSTRLWKYRWFYVMFLPVFVTVFIFYYLPMAGIRFAFYKYTPFMPEPVFVGLEQFKKLWSMPSFWSAFENTIVLSLINLALSMIISIGFALLINEIAHKFLKRFVQTLVYLPHFISWVVVASIFTIILSPNNGFVNDFLLKLHIIDEPIYFLANEDFWRPIYFFINRWKETGWGTVIFLASLSAISPDLYEAASIDGAGRWKQTWNITIPGIMSTFLIVLILNLAKVLNLFESVLVLYNDKVFSVSDVLQTYVYRMTLLTPTPDYGYTTAVGLFKSIISCFLVLMSNYFSKKIRGTSIV